MARGRKTGGRQKGSRNRATEEARAVAAASGTLPLDYMLSVMRDPDADAAGSIKRSRCCPAARLHCDDARLQFCGKLDNPSRRVRRRSTTAPPTSNPPWAMAGYLLPQKLASNSAKAFRPASAFLAR